MGMLARSWLALAVAGIVGGQAVAATVEVATAPIHTVPDAADELPATQASAEAPAQRAAAPGVSVAVARRVIDAAGAFDGYMHGASAIDARFGDGSAVARAVLAGSAYEPRQLQSGAIAYAALVALQDPLFVQVVSDVGQDPGERAAFIERLQQDPGVVLRAPAAQTEATRVAAVLARVAGRLMTSGRSVKQAAYDVQHQPWSKQAIVEPQARLTRVKAQSSISYALAPEDTARLMASVSSWRGLNIGLQAGEYTPTPVVTQGLALAALAVLGAAGEENADQIAPLLADPASAQCVKMAKLNLYQCLSVAGPHYEDVYCLGRHALMDTAQCVVTASGWTGAESGPPPAVAPAPTVATRSVLVPIALASTIGPEQASVFGVQAGPTPERAADPALAAEPAVAAPSPTERAPADAAPASPYASALQP